MPFDWLSLLPILLVLLFYGFVLDFSDGGEHDVSF